MSSSCPTFELSKSVYREALIMWKISDFSLLSENVGEYQRSSTFRFAGDIWYLRIYAGGDRRVNDRFISLHLIRETWNYRQTMDYTFGIENANGKIEDIAIFRNRRVNCDNSFFSSTFMEKSQLLTRKSELLPSDILTITCFLNTSTRVIDEVDPAKSTMVELKALSENFKNLLTNQWSCDTTLRVQGKDFKTHKSVLIARSPVFAAMFQNDMLEKSTGVVCIDDCDPNSFEKFLLYLYSGEFEDISFQSALHLYKAAQKYLVAGLISICVQYMMNNLTVDNVCHAFILGDSYGDNQLFSAAKTYFYDNFNLVIQTDEWLDFLTEKPRLANRLLIDMPSKSPTYATGDTLKL